MQQYLAEFKRFLYRELIPVTKGTIILNIAVFLVTLFTPIVGIQAEGWLWLNPLNVLGYPWTILTYALVNDLLSVIFGALWLWLVGAGLERMWGSTRYGWFLVMVTGVTGLAMAIIGFWLKVAVPVFGIWLPLVGVTWAWARLDPHRELLFWGIVPVKARWLAWIHTVLVFATYARIHILFGIAGIIGIFLANLNWGKGRRSTRGVGDNSKRLRRSRLRVIK